MTSLGLIKVDALLSKYIIVLTLSFLLLNIVLKRAMCASMEESMQYGICVFRSRNETLLFSNFLRNNGISTAIVNTPKEAGQACGISVKFNLANLSIVKSMLALRKYPSFAGIYKITSMGLRISCERL